MYHYNHRTITTERLILRPFTLEDAQRVSELCNNYNVYKSTLSLPHPYPLESALAWIPTHEENFASTPASGKVMIKIGMTQEGVLKEHILKEGKYEDIVYYGIINPKA